MPFNAVDTARTGVVDQLVAMYDEAIAHTVGHLRQHVEHHGDALYAYTLGVDSWRAVARRAIPLTLPYTARADLCVMCTLRGMEEVYRDTLTVQLNRLHSDEDDETYDIADALTAILTNKMH